MNGLVLLRDWRESQIELWKPIQGFPGYDVSNLGRVRSWWRRGADGKWNSRGISRTECCIIRFNRQRQGYLDAALYRENGKRSIQKVHRLVATAFIMNVLNEPTVNHKNLVKSDNRLDNLEWASMRDQQQHLVALGLKPVPLNAGRRLTIEEITMAQDLLSQGFTKAAVARKVGASRPTVSNILKAMKKGRSYGSTSNSPR
jgi:hypothetical protein